MTVEQPTPDEGKGTPDQAPGEKEDPRSVAPETDPERAEELEREAYGDDDPEVPFPG